MNNSSRIINDWRPEVNSLLKRFTDAGAVIINQDNGEYESNYDPAKHDNFVLDLIACDEADLYVKFKNNPKNTWIYLVLGNSPGEMICDYTIPSDEATAKQLDEITSAHYEEWNGKEQPKTEADSFYTLYQK